MGQKIKIQEADQGNVLVNLDLGGGHVEVIAAHDNSPRVALILSDEEYTGGMLAVDLNPTNARLLASALAQWATRREKRTYYVVRNKATGGEIERIDVTFMSSNVRERVSEGMRRRLSDMGVIAVEEVEG